jgi:hypothetical protein
VIVSELRTTATELAARTGWVAKPEGLCKGPMCVPLPDGTAAGDGTLDLEVVTQRLGMPVLHDTGHGLWAIGPATVSGKALDTAEVPDVTLPDLDGNQTSLASFRGKKKVVAFAWASW